ncbi:hypothetical protein SAMN05421640_0086 [Ekhidna lutea]|uniref:Uncharacterized protein n=1 Tax=Ekhidna lutea TaxID=447679 RepID=A0A239EEW8_EKHLU|nr:hypothetical protein [Ekhidna lutea]SNS42553.1 hypothetical protein SAMN05421640_0086 [Ekhidna lutea]
MKAASLADIKRELKQRSPEELLTICLRLGRFKKDNKELLTYLLFEAGNEQSYIKLLKEDIDDMMEEINMSHLYYVKKGLQKIVRSLNKSLRYSGQKQTEVDARLYFCQRIQDSGIAINKHTTIKNLYHREIKRIEKALSSLHEDLQADYQYEIEKL